MSAGFMAKCGMKIRHGSQAEAEKHRGSLVARGAWTLRTSNTYKCSYCGFWHAGRTGTRNRGRR